MPATRAKAPRAAAGIPTLMGLTAALLDVVAGASVVLVGVLVEPPPILTGLVPGTVEGQSVACFCYGWRLGLLTVELVVGNLLDGQVGEEGAVGALDLVRDLERAD